MARIARIFSYTMQSSHMKSLTVINIAIALKVGQWRSSALGGVDMLRDKPNNIHFEFCKRLQYSLSEL